MVSGRSDLLPGGYERPVDAIRRLGPEGLNTLLYVHERGWDSNIEASGERLDLRARQRFVGMGYCLVSE